MFKSKYLKYKSKYLKLHQTYLMSYMFGGNPDLETIRQFNKKFTNFLTSIEHPINENFQNTRDVLIFAIGALSNNESGSNPLLEIHNLLDQEYYHNNVMLICIDNGDQNKTINDLEENGFTLFDSNSEMIEPTIHMFKKKHNNTYSFMLVKLTIPTNSEPYLVDEILNKCAEKKTFNDYFEYLLNSIDNTTDSVYSEFMLNIVRMVNSKEIIFMNDMHFNTNKYWYETSNFVSSVPIDLLPTNNNDINQIVSYLKITIPASGRYSLIPSTTNILFSEIIWIISLMKMLLSENYNVYIMEVLGTLLKNQDKYKLMLVRYPNLEQKYVQLEHTIDYQSQF